MICSKCKQDKSNQEFFKDSSKKNGFRSHCKSCVHLYLVNRREKTRAYSKIYRDRNREKTRSYARQYAKKPEILDRKFRQDKKYREKLWEYKKQPCMDCSGIFHPCQMDFDHIDPTIKIKPVSLLKGNQNKMLEEIKKCEVVCANCHRLRTYNKKQWRPRKND